MTAATGTTGTAPAPGSGVAAGLLRGARRSVYSIMLLGLLAGLLLFTLLIKPEFGPFDLETIAKGAMPLAFAAVAQAIIVISGGIDLSIGSMMALSNVTAALLMAQAGPEASVGVVLAVLVMGFFLGAINGLLCVWTKVPDIVVTLAMSFVWAGAALLVLPRPGGGAAEWFTDLGAGSVLLEVLPKATVVLLIVVAIVWFPLRRTRLGLAIYAIGSDRLAAFRSGINVDRTRVAAYALGGFFAACGGLALTMVTGIGTPTTGLYTLQAVTAIVLGGVSLAGGRGGVVGPIAAAYILGLIRLDLVFLGVNPNFSTVIQGSIMILVVMIVGFITLRTERR
jgi:ribose transport system permease protein